MCEVEFIPTCFGLVGHRIRNDFHGEGRVTATYNVISYHSGLLCKTSLPTSQEHLPPSNRSNMAVDPLAPLQESSSRLREDDLEFCALTTILNLVNFHNEQESDNNSSTLRMQWRFKLLASGSAILVMDHEVIAIMPKRSATRLILFIGPEPNPDRDTDIDDESKVDNETLSAQHLVTKNPRDNVLQK